MFWRIPFRTATFVSLPDQFRAVYLQHRWPSSEGDNSVVLRYNHLGLKRGISVSSRLADSGAKPTLPHLPPPVLCVYLVVFYVYIYIYIYGLRWRRLATAQ